MIENKLVLDYINVTPKIFNNLKQIMKPINQTQIHIIYRNMYSTVLVQVLYSTRSYIDT